MELTLHACALPHVFMKQELGQSFQPDIPSPQWTSRIKDGKMPNLCTEAQKPLRMERTIILHVRPGDSYVAVCFGIVHNPAVRMQLVTSFIDCFIREIFRAKLNDVSWHSQPVAILFVTQRDQHIRTSISNVAAPLGQSCNGYKANSHSVPVA